MGNNPGQPTGFPIDTAAGGHTASGSHGSAATAPPCTDRLCSPTRLLSSEPTAATPPTTRATERARTQATTAEPTAAEPAAGPSAAEPAAVAPTP